MSSLSPEISQAIQQSITRERELKQRALNRPLFFHGHLAHTRYQSINQTNNQSASRYDHFDDDDESYDECYIIKHSQHPMFNHQHQQSHLYQNQSISQYFDEDDADELKRLEEEEEELRLLVEQVKAFVPILARTIGSIGAAPLFNLICHMLGFKFHLVQLDI